MADKRDLIMIHQLYGLVQQYLTHELDIDADAETLSNYSRVTDPPKPGKTVTAHSETAHMGERTNAQTTEPQEGSECEQTYADIGIGVIDINVSTEQKKKAVLTLGAELTNLIESLKGEKVVLTTDNEHHRITNVANINQHQSTEGTQVQIWEDEHTGDPDTVYNDATIHASLDNFGAGSKIATTHTKTAQQTQENSTATTQGSNTTASTEQVELPNLTTE